MSQAPIVLHDGPLGAGTGASASVDRDVMVRMRDGIHLACDVFRPVAPGKCPVLFGASPYVEDSADLPSTGMYRYRETGNIAKWAYLRGTDIFHHDALRPSHLVLPAVQR
ncbi:MAG: hypothetical protein IT514_11875 [Burkholderiales bacterium]|nr:hypothetical protein [Burkholderiales bacterium]